MSAFGTCPVADIEPGDFCSPIIAAQGGVKVGTCVSNSPYIGEDGSPGAHIKWLYEERIHEYFYRADIPWTRVT